MLDVGRIGGDDAHECGDGVDGGGGQELRGPVQDPVAVPEKLREGGAGPGLGFRLGLLGGTIDAVKHHRKGEKREEDGEEEELHSWLLLVRVCADA